MLSTFDIHYYHQLNPQFDIHYYNHLLDVARQYENINKLIDISARSICATHNTNEFLKSGGFYRILKIEERQDKIQNLTLRNLRQSIFATKDWWLLFLFTTLTAFLIAVITSLSVDKLSQKNLQPKTSQDSLLKSLATYILHQDSLKISYKDSFKIKK